jgi:cytochrome c peroxidase
MGISVMTRKNIIAAVVVVFAGGLALPLLNLAVGLPGDVVLGDPRDGSPEFRKATAALALKCASCHTAQGKIPFYANFPIVKQVIAKDIQLGTEYLDLVSDFAAAPEKAVREVSLAKLEYAAEHRTMPPARYLTMHWNGALNSSEREAVLRWIRAERTEHYASPASPEALRGAVLQPLPPLPKLDAAQVALGDKLFHDGRLSRDNSISCASCHGLDMGGTDRAQFSTGVGGATGGINAPTVYNSGLQVAQFWDGRAADLQEQADGPVNNPIEMASNWPEVIAKLEADEALKAAFAAAYPDGFSGENITHAIATFEETLLTPNSAFDRYLLGEEAALDPSAKAGYQLFLDTGCATFHVGTALGGQSFEKMGRKADYFADRGNPTDADLGLYNVTKEEKDKHHFKVPMLRNVALTAPYFHDGTVKTLSRTIEWMAKYQLGVRLPSRRKQQIRAFLISLTGEYQGERLR